MYKPAILALSILTATSVQAENLELPATAAIIAHSETIERPLDQVTFTDAAGTQIPLRFTTGLGSAAYHAAGIVPVDKSLALDSAVDIPGVLPAKVEGIAMMSDTEIQLINDNDFGIEGDATTLVHLRKPQGFFNH